MPQYIAFLRAINVGGRTVKMDRLREICQSLDLSDVETFIASGNVIFRSRARRDALERKIEMALEKHLGFQVDTFIRTVEATRAVAQSAPFGELDPGDSLYAGFLKVPPTAAAAGAVAAHSTREHRFVVVGEEVWWRRAQGSDLKDWAGLIEKTTGPMTVRNITTIRKLAAKYSGG